MVIDLMTKCNKFSSSKHNDGTFTHFVARNICSLYVHCDLPMAWLYIFTTVFFMSVLSACIFFFFFVRICFHWLSKQLDNICKNFVEVFCMCLRLLMNSSKRFLTVFFSFCRSRGLGQINKEKPHDFQLLWTILIIKSKWNKVVNFRGEFYRLYWWKTGSFYFFL